MPEPQRSEPYTGFQVWLVLILCNRLGAFLSTQKIHDLVHPFLFFHCCFILQAINTACSCSFPSCFCCPSPQGYLRSCAPILCFTVLTRGPSVTPSGQAANLSGSISVPQPSILFPNTIQPHSLFHFSYPITSSFSDDPSNVQANAELKH